MHNRGSTERSILETSAGDGNVTFTFKIATGLTLFNE